MKTATDTGAAMTKAERDARNRAKMANYYNLKPLLAKGEEAARKGK